MISLTQTHRVIPPNGRRRSLISAKRQVSFSDSSTSEAEASARVNAYAGSSSTTGQKSVSLYRQNRRMSPDTLLGNATSSRKGINLGLLSRSVGLSSKKPWRRLKDDFITEMRLLSTLRHPCITTVMVSFMLSEIVCACMCITYLFLNSRVL